MSRIIPVFQFEVRYSHILNFSQVARKILSPYVKLATGIRVEHQSTFQEKIILTFEDMNYYISIDWDRIIIRGQEDLDLYCKDNSPIEMPFFNILERIKTLEEFGNIDSVLFATTFLSKIDESEASILQSFNDKYLSDSSKRILSGNHNDVAIILDKKLDEENTHVSYGPYFGLSDLLRRPLSPVNIDALGDINFNGEILEYKYFKNAKSINFSDFVKIVNNAKKMADRLWSN